MSSENFETSGPSSNTSGPSSNISGNSLKPLETGAKLFVIDDQNPEDLAMMQALYSRSSSSVLQHLEKVKKTGSGKFMESFYVGYGHQSIGDCGSTTIFIENVSILAAKAIQDWPLYSGQETSTRYIDMSKQNCTDPVKNDLSQQILDSWLSFYLKSQEPLKAFLKQKYPIKPEESASKKLTDTYNKAITARAFDILRAFLPAGINTQLAWHTNLRQAAHKLALMNHHPDPIIKQISNEIHEQLKLKYPHSFNHKLYEKTEDYRSFVSQNYTYHEGSSRVLQTFLSANANANANVSTNNPNKQNKQQVICETHILPQDLEEYESLIKNRPPKTELPNFLLDLGLVKFSFLIDFGSFRDLQRHRNGVCRMPLLTMDYGFHSWYLDQLSEDLKQEAIALIELQSQRIKELGFSQSVKPETLQYYIPLGFQVFSQVSYGLPAAIYTIELRSGVTVHASLRQAAHSMKAALLQQLPDLVIHTDDSLDEWDIRRGDQDIVSKTS